MRIQLFLMRHSKSCSNHLRHNTKDSLLIKQSQEVRDPALSEKGVHMATEYGAVIRRQLKEKGFNLTDCVIGASALRRAQQTAKLVFNCDSPVTWRHFTENGRLPENTPTADTYKKPDWKAFIRDLANHSSVTEGASVIAVGHGSFLAGMMGSKPLHNLDGFLLDITIEKNGEYTIHKTTFIPWKGEKIDHSNDRCMLQQTSVSSRMHKRTTKRRRQRGGMPQGYFLDGAQMRETVSGASGMDTYSSGMWARSPLDQTGGFSPTIMGSFVPNGMRFLAPATAYSAYKLYNGWKGKGKRTRKGKGRR